MKGRNRKKITYRYEKLEGVNQTEIDRYLVSMITASELSKMVMSSSILSKNLSYNRIQLMNGTVPYEQLVDDITGQLENCYAVYNEMMSQVYPAIQRFEDQFKKDKEYMNLSTEQEQLEYLFDQLEKALEGDPFRQNKLVCWLRLKPALHTKLVGIIDGTEKKEEEEVMQLVEAESGRSENKEKFGQQISAMKELILKMEEQAKDVDDGNVRVLKEEILVLQNEVNENTKELKAKEKELKSKEKEIQKIQKRYDDENKKRETDKKLIEKFQKDNGELGKKIGDLRKELESITARNRVLEQEKDRLDNSKNTIISTMESAHEQKLAVLKRGYEEEISSLTEMKDQAQKLNEKLNEKFRKKQEQQQSENDQLKLELAELSNKFEEEISILTETKAKAQQMNEKLYAKLQFENGQLQNENIQLKRQLDDMKREMKTAAQSTNGIAVAKKEEEIEPEEDLFGLFENSEFEPEFS